MSEFFLSKIEVKKVIIVNDHRFIHPDTEEMCDVRPVMLKDIILDSALLKDQNIFLFPQVGDIEKEIFMVFYDRYSDK